MKVRALKPLPALGILALVMSLPMSPNAAPVDVVEKMTGAQVEKIFNDLGFAGTEVDEDGDVIVKMQGYKVLVLVGSSDGDSLLMRFSVTGTNANMKMMNEWNRTKRYSRAYIDDEGDPVLESDQDLDGGVTIERIEDFFRTFDTSLMVFLRTIT